ncbi:hypothetical protein AALP_AA1G197200 [Arabis alpina]|uniref:Leucine-rich repeat-containing N-terminal plant-type domain-containing protein n=1 Tax=Arabis alpina TaxID=50452 RepID=A0A087HPB2_ARAAL|nr:hypothetical protein AALP_AA1G197200 [Arabis alpina]
MMILSQSHSFVTIYVFFLVSHTLASSTTLQRDALLEFKNEFPTPDPNSFYNRSLTSWNTSSDHCSWEGVKCDGKSGGERFLLH